MKKQSNPAPRKRANVVRWAFTIRDRIDQCVFVDYEDTYVEALEGVRYYKRLGDHVSRPVRVLLPEPPAPTPRRAKGGKR